MSANLVSDPRTPASRFRADVAETLVQWFSTRTGVEPDAVDIDRPMTSQGLDSIKAAELIAMLSERFALSLPVDKLFTGLSIADIASHAPSPTHSATPPPALSPAASSTGPAFSLLFFSSDADGHEGSRYQLLLDCAALADERGFEALWLPERHFHRFGGLFPNPSVVAAALAARTRRIRIRAGSVVLPLHHPVRVAEEWAVVDNLSGGRVDVAFAAGWNADDFVLSPAAYSDRSQRLPKDIETVRRLWHGETITLPNGAGEDVPVRIFPEPAQPDLPIWITCSGGIERFRQAGALGANVLTALLFQDIEELGTKVRAYREARAENNFDPEGGRVTLMMHTYLGHDQEAVRRTVAQPFTRYLADSVDLWRRGSTKLEAASPVERERMLSFAFERYYRTSALFGTPESVTALVEQLRDTGVDEIACLIDFGIPEAEVKQGLRTLAEFRDRLLVDPDANTGPEAGDGYAPRLASNPLHRNVIGGALQSRHAAAHHNSHGVLDKVKKFDLTRRLREADLLPFYAELSGSEGATCLHEGRRLIMLGSNNYLGLTADERVRHAAAVSALSDGPSLTGSRLLNGTTAAQIGFERRLAHFLGREDALLFTTGYQANIGLLSAIMGPGTVLIVDEECHASIYDGAAVGHCDVVQFHHNDVGSLRSRLEDHRGRPAMVMVDGVYSMSGDLAPLTEIREACELFGVPLAVDDAHGLGMVGTTGRGAEEESGALETANILTGTFSKSLASVGGWLAGDRQLTEWVRYHGKSMLFSAAIPPPALAAAAAALDILIAEPWRLQRIRENAEYWRNGLRAQGFDVGNSRTAIVPVMVGDEMDCLRFGKGLLDAGVYANCVVAPAVPSDRALIRTSVTAIHEQQHLDQALDVFGQVGRMLGLLP
ncbi:hypothetical protein IFM12275_23540 [Nocardia sputorum]|uniref:MupA/Atu3671 family FMN-dependent luciferase-like monooxygenase n=1 Tax=Nocardia sputorum TaxID=2984338 RepID=UPI0024919BA5|nr:MupA/Atu3671 family FMN-dependent luciferase-like monooxygenase [Nocardia sputorum]BDT92378.1 hypothetical protein IFM12275_23540 [Nocardia sputorum]